ncbi:MAG TPA: ring-cleaving dioxygenase [Pseudogracilibacillus sp.]|nr:ring-cleaving dioxygenase [Pseudogracilibacillus sp.]
MHDILGHHHTSMMTKDINENNYFYTHIMGLRRVKITVNQDDPSMYHLFYGDRVGSPGTELTFFEMPYIGNTYRGTNAISRIGLLVPSESSLTYWKKRLAAYDVLHDEVVTTYVGRKALHFEDPDGLRLVLVVANEEMVNFWQPWEQSNVPIEQQIRGMGPIEITVRRLEKFKKTLTGLLHYKEIENRENEITFQAVKGEVYGEIIAKELDGKREKPGKGSVHHIAIRVKDKEALMALNEKIKAWGFETTGVIDRYYFSSLYFRESNGIMFEIATDGPGFIIDKDEASLGVALDLPPFLEERREEIEATLRPIKKIE